MREPLNLIHLDALLAWARVEEEKQQAEPKEFGEVQHDLPLEKLVAKSALADWNGNESFAASALIYTPHLRELRYWTRKTNPEKMANAQKDNLLAMRGDQVSTGSGAWKAFSEFEPLIHTRTLTAWCIGDQARIEELLSKITHLGKKRTRNYGLIESIKVTEDDAARDMVKYRVLTWPESESYRQAQCGVAPPYWESNHIGFVPSKKTFDELMDKTGITLE